MLYSLILNFVDSFTFLNVFKYLTVRTGLAMFTSMLVVFLIGTPFINFFSARQIINLIKNNINNNDYLMIKGSNATGLHKLTGGLKKERKNVL